MVISHNILCTCRTFIPYIVFTDVNYSSNVLQLPSNLVLVNCIKNEGSLSLDISDKSDE